MRKNPKKNNGLLSIAAFGEGRRQNPAKDNQWHSKGAWGEATPVAARRGPPKSWQIVFSNLYKEKF